MQVFPNRFSQELRNGLKSCYMLFGDEPQQKFAMLQAVRDYARQAGFDERTVLTADGEFGWHQLIEATQAMSLFASAQLIELELPSGKPGTEGAKVLQEVAATLGQDVLLIIHGPRIGKDVQKTKWFKALDAVGVFAIAYPLEGKALNDWLRQTLQQHQLQADNEVVSLLADYTEGNMLAAHQEIEKLSLLFAGQTVTREQVSQVVVDQSRFTVFQLVDVMLAGDQTRTVKMLYRLESEGIEPAIVLWALAREWQTLWKLHQQLQQRQPIAWQKHGIWRNRQAAYQAALNRLSTAQLAQIRDSLRDADVAFKQHQVARPYIKLCHLVMLFLGVQLALPLGA